MLPSRPPLLDYKMIDFISIIKPNRYGKVSPYFGHCQIMAEYPSTGAVRYRLEGCEGLDIYWNPNGFLKLQGSIMYYWQGHNFTYSPEAFQAAIDYIGKMLHVGLWDCIVEVFEYGVIMPVEVKPRDYIQHHKAKPSEHLHQFINGKDKGNFTSWQDSNVRLKMYDAGKNIEMKQGMSRRDIIQEAGWNPQDYYLKWEAHYLKPYVLNHGNGVILANLINPDWQDIFKEDLYQQYKRLIPMANVEAPTSKADLSTADIIALALVEDNLNESKTLQEVKKMLYNRINSFPDEVLSKSDKDARKRQVKAILGKMREADTSKWDLSQQLAAALQAGTGDQGDNQPADTDPLI